jgi:serine/threonine protein phosphatase PrpC
VDNISFFGVFDGHGGSLCSKYCKSELFDIIREQASFPHDMSRALIDGFSSIDTIVCELSEEAIDFQDGTTATVVVVDHAARQMWVAHVGDTRCILVRKDGTTLPLTRDHSCALTDECRRIRDVGGFVVQCGDIGRVLGVLAVTRAIGDALLKPSVTAVPEVRRVDLSGEDGDSFGFVCIGSDGIWDEVSNDEAGRIVAAKGVRRAANDITKLALDRGSEDNLTFLAVDISRDAAVTSSGADPDASPEGTATATAAVLADSAQQRQLLQQDITALKRRRTR